MSLRAVKQIIEPKPTIEAAGVKLQRAFRSARPGNPGDKEVSQATKGDDSVTWIGRVK